MDKASFDDYITRFKRRDTTAFEDYLADDMHMKNGTLEYDGVQGMKDRFTAESDDPESLFGPVLEGRPSSSAGSSPTASTRTAGSPTSSSPTTRSPAPDATAAPSIWGSPH
ncbi:hypothetical protein [Nocardioides sp. KR10-350]|uniref:hypothetical protein n=1 Tax=Nocardioides cheoyonin TaxID=3156615 RepID=UPI0032B3CDD2